MPSVISDVTLSVDDFAVVTSTDSTLTWSPAVSSVVTPLRSGVKLPAVASSVATPLTLEVIGSAVVVTRPMASLG